MHLILKGFHDVLRRNSQLASSIMQTLLSQVSVYHPKLSSHAFLLWSIHYLFISWSDTLNQSEICFRLWSWSRVSAHMEIRSSSRSLWYWCDASITLIWCTWSQEFSANVGFSRLTCCAARFTACCGTRTYSQVAMWAMMKMAKMKRVEFKVNCTLYWKA